MTVLAAILAFAYPFFTTNRTDYGYVFTQLPTNMSYKMNGVVFDENDKSVRYEDILFYNELANERLAVKERITGASSRFPIMFSPSSVSESLIRTSSADMKESAYLQYILASEVDSSLYSYAPHMMYSPAVKFYWCFSDNEDSFTACLDPTSIPDVSTNAVVTAPSSSVITDIMDDFIDSCSFRIEDYISILDADLLNVPMYMGDLYAISTYSEPLTRFSFAMPCSSLMFTNYIRTLERKYQSYFYDDTYDRYEYLHTSPDVNTQTNKEDLTYGTWSVEKTCYIENLKQWKMEKDRVWNEDDDRAGWGFTFTPKFDGWIRSSSVEQKRYSLMEIDMSPRQIYYKDGVGSNGASRVVNVRSWGLFNANLYKTATTTINAPDEIPYTADVITTEDVSSNIWFVAEASLSFESVRDMEYKDWSSGDAWTNKVSCYSITLNEEDLMNRACGFFGVRVPSYDNQLPDLPTYTVQNFTDWDDTEADDYNDDHEAYSAYSISVKVTLQYVFGYADCDMNATIPQEGEQE